MSLMATVIDERNRILHMIEAGQVMADQAAQLLDALDQERKRSSERLRDRTIRVRTTSLNPKRQKIHLMATIPVQLLAVSLRLGARLMPQLSDNRLHDLLRSIEGGATGRLLDLQDLEKGERVEIFVE